MYPILQRIYRITLLMLLGLLLWTATVPGVTLAEERVSPRLATERSDTQPPLPSLRPSMAIPVSLNGQNTAPAAAPVSRLAAVGGRMPAPNPETSPAVQTAVATGEKWIRVALSEQKVYAYEGQALVNTFLVSTGLPRTPTVTGEFRMWTRTPIQDMSGGSRASGDYYYLRDVQWVQYFYGDYAFHGTYWHTNYGSPASRGCVNMTNEDAKWLFDWAFPQWNGQKGWYRPTDENATLVIVHP
jgi:lipoprotein-anchoring transpeptidase ErfK/SrfK